MKPVPESYEQSFLYKVRHSVAHVMAEAVRFFYPQVKLAIGPPIEDGFYYDFDLGQDENGKPLTFSPEDVSRIEGKMRELLKAAAAFQPSSIPIPEALALFADQPYKLELIHALAQGKLDENGDPLAEPVTEVGIYQQRDFLDLCRGPHVANTAEIDPDGVKLLRSSGAYWRGDETRPQLQRIYGTAWLNQADLDAYLQRLEEAQKRDHRKLGKQLELFHLDETAPGMPYWLPNGMKVLNQLIQFWREVHEAEGYQEIAAPLVNDKKLWVQSGHWDHYRDNMFLIQVDEQKTYLLKPMNCPNAMIIFGLKKRSYRDLPLRLADTDSLHRLERAGTLHGLLRVQNFKQDDAHIFLNEALIEEEYQRIFKLVDKFYALFGLSYSLKLGTRPEEFLGEIETWNRAEAILHRILMEHAGPDGYEVVVGDGAFYGPKVDIYMADALGREWQMGTIQLDYQLPQRFDLKYTDRDGQEKSPVVVHRVIYGSLERFIGILIEHFAGAFPLWLAPVQAMVIPIAERHNGYARQVANELRVAGLRVQVDENDDRMNKKIRNAQLLKIPYMLVIGDKEAESQAVAVRTRTGEDRGAMSVAEFKAQAVTLVGSQSMEL
jgi:threonyl-tRNA synthetase